MKEFKMVLESVSDCYEDFVIAMKTYLEEDEENRNKIIEYIENNPAKRTDDILEYLDELWDITPDTVEYEDE